MQLSPMQIQDDLAFWLNQDREHNLFFMLGFQDAGLKREAERLYQAYDAALRRGDLAMALSIVPMSQAFKRAALVQLSPPWAAGKAGYIWPSFIEHTAQEIDMMIARAQGRTTSRQEICFGDRMLAEHAAFASSLLDPVRQRDLANTALAASAGVQILANRCERETMGTLVLLSKKAQDTLDGFLHDPKIANGSAIHPVLADHVIREGRRFGSFLSAVPNDESRAA